MNAQEVSLKVSFYYCGSYWPSVATENLEYHRTKLRFTIYVKCILNFKDIYFKKTKHTLLKVFTQITCLNNKIAHLKLYVCVYINSVVFFLIRKINIVLYHE